MSIELSTKFKSDLIKFFEWVEVANYTIKEKGVDQEWSLNLNKEFIEPARNKLAVFIELLMKKYNIYLDDSEIIDAKQFVKNFKDYKPLKKERKMSPKSPRKKSVPKAKKCNINIDLSLDTSTNGMLCPLKQSTEELEKVFGCKANFTGGKDSRYEWKFTMNNEIYSVYDWGYVDNTFDDYQKTEWFLGGDNESIENIKMIRDFLSKRINPEVLCIKSDEFVDDSDDETVSKMPNVLEL